MKIEIVIIQKFANPDLGTRTSREYRFDDLQKAQTKYRSCLMDDTLNRGYSETEIHIAVLE
jgi:hypothetical protein